MVRRIQAVSGLLFAAFLAAHLFNTWLAVLGPGAYDGAQRLLALVYQAPVLEWLVLGAVLVHVGCALVRWRRERRGTLPLRARLHRYAGVFLMVVIAGHVNAVRLVPAAFGIRPGFEGLAFTLQVLPGVFYPYYLVLGLTGAYHGVNGAMVALRRLGVALWLPGRWLYGMAGVAAALTLAALLGFGGALFPVADAGDSAYARMAARIFDGG
ncbi:MAG: hypothetical protein ACODAC_03790 [Pseudomonadota bacterium]